MKDPINNNESIVSVPLSIIGATFFGTGVWMYFLMLFVFRNPTTILGVLIYLVASLLIVFGGLLVIIEYEAGVAAKLKRPEP
jgi:hypothetical protein